MTAFDTWLTTATRRLSIDSAARVRTEIEEHYEAARETAIEAGATPEEASRKALLALGNAKTANRQYRRVLLTSAEARLLRESNAEARFLCSRPWRKRLLVAVPIAAILASIVFYLANAPQGARIFLAAAIGTGVTFAAPCLPLYTAKRSRLFRAVKWAALLAALLLALEPLSHRNSWLFYTCLWPLVWVEWTRASIRRKLPVARWPKQLYL